MPMMGIWRGISWVADGWAGGWKGEEGGVKGGTNQGQDLAEAPKGEHDCE